MASIPNSFFAFFTVDCFAPFGPMFLDVLVHLMFRTLSTFLFAHLIFVHISPLLDHIVHFLQHRHIYGAIGQYGHFHSGSRHKNYSNLVNSLIYFQVILLVYAVIPFPLYLCIISCGFYSFFFELLASPSSASSSLNSASAPTFRPGTKAAIHICVHLLGIHLYILTQVRQRKTFLKVGQSLLARKDLELETQFKAIIFKNNFIGQFH
jgi:hypothetical protein